MWIKPRIRDVFKNMFEYIKEDVNVTRLFCKWCYVIMAIILIYYFEYHRVKKVPIFKF
jgi:hypothetical protein